MITIQIKTYDEQRDVFTCDAIDSAIDSIYEIELAASLMPYIAVELVEQCDDLPFDLIDKRFALTSPLID